MNASLNSLKLAIQLAVEDSDVTAYDVTTTIKNTLKELSQSHLVRSNKAGSVCEGLNGSIPLVASTPPRGTMPSFGSLSDTTICGGAGTDTISFGAAQMVPPYFGAGGGDVISFT